MRTLVISDIHGRLDLLDRLLDTVAPGSDDSIVTLGDYVDGGPNSRGVIERLIELRRTHRLIPLRGNHDQMMLDARDDEFSLELWLTLGGASTIESYSGGSLGTVPLSHWVFLDSCLDYHETATHIFVHGYVEPETAMSEQPRRVLHWTRVDASLAGHTSGKVICCGHAALDTDRPLDLGHAICIDMRGWLTCLDVESRTIAQVNHAGTNRRLCLGGPGT